MDTEVEATFINIDINDLRERLKDVGAELIQEERLMRRRTLDFDHPEEKFHRWARVRDEGDKITATYKQHVIDKSNVDIDHQKEIEVEVGDFKQAVSLLEAVGCERSMYQENKRESWSIRL
jgi:adenylate cyclase class 2